MRLLILLILASTCMAREVPHYVLAKLLRIESSSKYLGKRIVWVDKRIGEDGERGCFQMTPAAWEDIKKPGERFEDLDNTVYAERCAIRFLSLKYKHSWDYTVTNVWNTTRAYKRKWHAPH